MDNAQVFQKVGFASRKTQKQNIKTMQKIIKAFSPLVLALIILAGCKSPTFTQTPVVDTSGHTNYVYTVSPQTSNTLATISGVLNQVPNTGFAPVDLGKDVALGVLGLASGVLGLIARIKSNSATQHAAAADVLAGTVVKNNLTVQALQNATPQAAGMVAQHIDNNTNT